jgi:DNA-binding NtrC family response regulator
VAPHVARTNLPAPVRGEGLQEREILYKLLFDMKGDLQDLKQLVFELIRSNNLRLPDTLAFRSFATDDQPALIPAENWPAGLGGDRRATVTSHDRPSIILEDKPADLREPAETNLALEDMEKEMIRKSLKRHGGRRKEAALELGISERTLYRKIKQYDL